MEKNETIFETIFNSKITDSNTEAYLTKIVTDYPYYSVGHFFLLQQLKEDSIAYKNQVAKTNLHFNNPYWLQYQLHHINQLKSIKNNNPVSSINAENTSSIKIEENNKIGGFEEENKEIIDDVNATHLSPSTNETIPNIKLDLATSIKDAENENALTFEPMHLVDYFASQGIKITDETQMADKLGKQMKSFSEWLKTMKKIHPSSNINQQVTHSDTIIQHLAEKSNSESEIITEAMASVYIQQGKLIKAKELYLKLSLLNPLKSAYFAAKIEQLKGI